MDSKENSTEALLARQEKEGEILYTDHATPEQYAELAAHARELQATLDAANKELKDLHEEWADDLQQMANAIADAHQPSRTSAEALPEAFLILRPVGIGTQQSIEREVVLAPLTDDTFLDEGDEAWPLYRALPLPGDKNG